jgi:hypothetical protein
MSNGDLEGKLHDETAENPEVFYERRDLSARGVLGFLIGLGITGLIIHIVLWGMYSYLDDFHQRHQPEQNPLALVHNEGRGSNVSAADVEKFPTPRLETSEHTDLAAERKREQALLYNEGVDAKTGVVHISIDRAMSLLAQRGLPARPPSGGEAQKLGQTGNTTTKSVEPATAVSPRNSTKPQSK